MPIHAQPLEHQQSTATLKLVGDEGGDPAAKAHQSIARRLAAHIGLHRYAMWFASTSLRVEQQTLHVATDSAFAARWIESNFATELRAVASEAIGADARYLISHDDGAGRRRTRTAEESTSGAGAAEPQNKRESASRGGSAARGAEPRSGRRRRTILRSLDDFIIGASNELAHSAALRIAECADGRFISPLFIHGSCGVGKTHLLQGVCRRFTDLGGAGASVRYVTGEQFTNEYIAAVGNGRIEEFRNRIRRLDLLAIDDVHFLSNKTRTQNEFLYTLDAIGSTGARLVMASDEHPRHVRRFSQGLISRFLSGMVVQIDPPDHQMRLRLVRSLASGRGLRLSNAASEAIAAQCTHSVRELEGAITKLAAMHALAHSQSPSPDASGEVGLLLVQRLLGEQCFRPPAPVRIAAIIDVVCRRLGVCRADLLGSGRHRLIVLARAIIAYLGREMTTLSFPEIADAMGRRHHSTVHAAAQRLRRQIDENQTMDLGRPAEMIGGITATGSDRPMALRDLVDQLRHEVLRQPSADG